MQVAALRQFLQSLKPALVHGDAVIAIASTSPGRRPSPAALAIADRSAQMPSG